MKKVLVYIFFLTFFLSFPSSVFANTRDPLKWPFSSNSIWNMPIGSGAVYVPANFDPNPTNFAWPTIPTAGEELIILDPLAPLTDVYYSDAGWTGRNRCTWTAPQKLLTRINLPANFIIPDLSNGTHLDNAATILNSDGRTLQQMQPLTRCNAGGYATAQVKFEDSDIYGDGRIGTRGGSGLSAFGGSIRLSELRPGQIGMKHALKMGVPSKTALYKCTTPTNCYRWPARWADGYAVGGYGVGNNNQNTAMKMGALLTIPPPGAPGGKNLNTNELGLETEPAKQLAWTLQNYGAYIVDTDAADPNTGFMLENGSEGSKVAEFYNDWGYNFKQNGYRNTAHPAYKWQQDIIKILRALYVVDNNSPSSIGGGGIPRQPLAPPLGNDQISPPPTSTPTPSDADINLDNFINNLDIQILFDNWKTALLNPKADINHDGKVNGMDYVKILLGWR